MNKIILPILLLSVLIIGQGCHTTKKVNKVPDQMSGSELIQYLNTHLNAVDWLYAKAKIDVDHPSLSMSFSATIKMEAGENIWANGKKFGFEAGRVLIKKDSVFVINRLEKSYMAEGLDFLEKNNLPDGLPAVQHLLLGNPILSFDESYEVKKTPGGVKISGQQKGVDLDYYYSMPSLTLDKVVFYQKGKNKKMTLTLGEYALIDGKINFPYLRNISVQNGNERFGAEVKFTKVEIDVPQEIKFAIPSHYSKMSY